MTLALCLVFFLSGAAALIFETLWFHQAGLLLGNSVWASSLVLAGFMGGLAFGNGLVGALGHRVSRPVRLYAGLEIAIGATGLALVHLLPQLTPVMAPWLGPLQDQPWLLNALRLGLALLLLLAPSTAMGATLPLLVAALYRRDSHFGRVLGRLYGWNTLGAVCGALAAEGLLIGWLGIRGSALFAAGLNAGAALLVVALARGLDAEPPPARPPPGAALAPRSLALLAAAFLCGGILLAFEVVWFRFLLLFAFGSSLAFATMLATVLAGIGLGGLLGALWLSRDAAAARHLPAVLFASGVLAVAVYAGFDLVASGTRGRVVTGWLEVLRLGAALMLPVSLLSGLLFTLLGDALHRQLGGETRAAGLLALANTTGAMLGSLTGGFALLPGLGIEASIRVLAGLYAGTGLLLAAAGWRPEGRRESLAFYAAGAPVVLAVALFPVGLMQSLYVRYPIEHYIRHEAAEPVEIREGLTETSIYLVTRRFGEPLMYRLVTNSHSMSSTSLKSKRYMKLFVYLPVALHPSPRRALLISYGVGETAKALTDTRSLEEIDVVDISRDILEMGRIVYPDPSQHPLSDPRVRVHVEDGRHFLQTTEKRFDLITGEPPPPKAAGIVNLYTTEYFQLMRDRLAEGGIVSYWLPAHVLLPGESKSLVRAFCAVFSDCSLWSGADLDWLLLGTRDAAGPGSEARFSAQWRDPRVARELRALGFETPAQLGSLFMAGPEHLRALAAGAEPLEDDHPKRLADFVSDKAALRQEYASWMDAERARERFAASPLVERLWPASLREAALETFPYQALVDEYFVTHPSRLPGKLPALHRLLTDTSFETLPLWLAGSSAQEQAAVQAVLARGGRGAALDYQRGLRALAQRRYALAARYLGLASRDEQVPAHAPVYRVYALAMAGRLEEARALAAESGVLEGDDGVDPRVVEFLSETFGLDGAAG